MCLTPSDLSRTIRAMPELKLPDYDWSTQQRGDRHQVLMGRITNNSIQTFDGHGRPKDSRSDSND